MDPAAVPLWRDAAGCPVHASLSRAGDWMGVGSRRPGVDMEPLARTDMLPEMTGGACDSSELAEPGTLAVDQRGRALQASWVREVLLKAAGTGTVGGNEQLRRALRLASANAEGAAWLELLESRAPPTWLR